MEGKNRNGIKYKIVNFFGLKILDIYVIRKFLGSFFLSIALILSIVVIFDLSEKIDDFIESGAGLREILFDYYLNFIPYFAVLFSSMWTMKEFIFMWFEITNAIYVGGASGAIIGGLYWSRSTTQGAWAGMLTGAILSVAGIVARQMWPGMTFPGSEVVINGMHIAIFAVAVSVSGTLGRRLG